MPSLPGNLDKLLTKGDEKDHILNFEKFINTNKATPLRDLLTPNNTQHEAFKSLIQKVPKTITEQIKIPLANTSHSTTLADSSNSLNDLKQRISAQRRELNGDKIFTGKNQSIKLDIFKELSIAETKINAQVSAIKKQLQKKESSIAVQGKADAEITAVETILETQTILALQARVEYNNKDHISLVTLYKLTSNTPLCIARYLTLLETLTTDENTHKLCVEACLNSIKEAVEAERHSDENKTFKAIIGDITLNDLLEIQNWSRFKINLSKKLKETRATADIPDLTSTTNNTDEKLRLLTEQNIQLRATIAQLRAQTSTPLAPPEAIVSANSKIEAIPDSVEEAPAENRDTLDEEFSNPMDDAQTFSEVKTIFENTLLQRNSEIDELFEENTRLRTELAALKEEVLKKSLGEASSSSTAFLKIAKEKNKTIATQQERITLLEQKLSTNVVETDEEIELLKNDLDKARQDLFRVRNQLKRRSEAVETQSLVSLNDLAALLKSAEEICRNFSASSNLTLEEPFAQLIEELSHLQNIQGEIERLTLSKIDAELRIEDYEISDKGQLSNVEEEKCNLSSQLEKTELLFKEKREAITQSLQLLKTQLTQKIEQIVKENQTLQEELTTNNGYKESNLLELAQLKKDKEKLVSELDEIKKELENKIEIITLADQQRDFHREKSKNLQAQVQNLTEEVDLIQKKLEETEKRPAQEQLDQAIEEADEAKRLIVKTQQELEQLQDNLDKTTREYALLTKQRMPALEAKLHDAETLRDKQAIKIDDLQQAIEELERTHQQELKAQSEEAQRTSEQTKHEFELEIEELKLAKEKAEKNWSDNKAEIDKLQEKLLELTHKNALTLQEQQTAYQLALDEEKRKFNIEIEKAEQEQTSNEGEIERLTGKIEALTRDYNQSLEEQQKVHQLALEDANHKFEERAKELTQAKEKAEHNSDAYQAETIRLQAEIQSTAEQYRLEKEQQQQALKVVQNQLLEKEDAVEKSAAEMLHLRKELTNLTAEKENLIKASKKYLNIEAILSKVEAEKLKLETQLRQLESQSAAATAEKNEIIGGLKVRLEEIEAEIQTLSVEKERLELNKEGDDKTLKKLQSELDEKTVALTSLSELNELLSSEIVAIRRERQTLIPTPGIEVSIQTDLEAIKPLYPPFSLDLSEADNLDSEEERESLQKNHSDTYSESEEEDGVGQNNAALQGTYNENFTDSNLSLSRVQSTHDTNKRGPRMPSPEEQAKQLLKNPDFKEKLASALTERLPRYFSEEVSNALGSHPNKSRIHGLINDFNHEVSQALAAKVKPQPFCLDELQDALSELFTSTPNLAENNEAAAQKLSEEIVANNANYIEFSSFLKKAIEIIIQKAQTANQVITTLAAQKQTLVEFVTHQLQSVAIQAAKDRFPDTNWESSEPFSTAVETQLAEGEFSASSIVKHLRNKSIYLKNVVNALSSPFPEQIILERIKAVLPEFLNDLTYREQSVIEQVEKMGIDIAQRQHDENLTFPKSTEAGQLHPFMQTSNHSSSNVSHTDELELTPLNSFPVQRRPSSSSISSTDSDEDESESNNRTTRRPKRQSHNRPVIKKVALNPDALKAAVRAFADDKTLPADETLMQLRVLQYANTEEEAFSLAIQALCSMNAAEGVEDLIPFSTFSTLRYQLRTEAAKSITDSPEFISPQDIETLDAKHWLEKKLKQITHRPVNVGLTEAEKLKTAKLVEKKFPFSELNLSAITLKSSDELQADIAKLKRFELKLVAQSYQEFSGIESLLPHYPLLIEERNDDVSSESEDSGIENQSELQCFNDDLNEKLSEEPNLSEDQARSVIDAISKQIAPGFHKWKLLTARLDPKLIKEIVANLNQAEFRNISNKEELVSKAINLLREEYQLDRILQERQEWEKGIKLHYAVIESVESLRVKVKHRLDLLEAMQDKKETHREEDAEREKERTGGKLLEGALDKTTVGQPLPVYLPSDCRVINGDSTLAQQTPNFSVAGEIFQRRDTLSRNETVVYEQNLGIRKQEWSITRTQNNALDYKTKWEHRWNPKSVTTKEVAFTQMIDAIQSFKRSKIIHFNFNNCTKKTEKKYRIFMRAYKELGVGPSLYCPANSKLKMKTSEIEEAKAFIIKQLKLQTEELSTNEKNISCFNSLLEAAIQPNIRIR